MRDDFEDPLAERLFEAARRERPRGAARAGTLRALSERRNRGSSSLAKLALVAALAGLAGLVVALRPSGAPAPRISAERPLEGPSHLEQPESPAARHHALPSAVAPTPSTVPPAPLARSGSAVKPRLATQQDELELLDGARELLAGGDAASALSALDRYDRTPSGRSLSAEAALLRMQALAASGRSAEVKALAEQFIARYPNSPLTDRARNFLGPAPSLSAAPAMESEK
jgi:hypothetical protein